MHSEFVVLYALSLTQPWATLCATEEKLRETRGWPTKFRGWVALHASKGFPLDSQDLCAITPFRQALGRAGYALPGDLPRGKVLAVVRLADCVATAKWTPPEDSNEYAFGDYSPLDRRSGKPRYSFGLEGVRRLREPFDCKGMLGIWRLPRPITEADLA